VLKNTRSPGLQILPVDVLCGGGLLGSTARQHQADGLFIDRADEAAAVKAGFCRIAAAAVGHAQKTHGVPDQLVD
jgi:hypothetical protein